MKKNQLFTIKNQFFLNEIMTHDSQYLGIDSALAQTDRTRKAYPEDMLFLSCFNLLKSRGGIHLGGEERMGKKEKS